ncbi:TetR/AcrR family transcriptional regulator [Methylovulum psychrotolerans]|uniref:TetR/AcrR family transcriptional regulator n=1 Tax=Methylovulum psychrotolerans TaxID=1704499 RepID=A0A2S5CLE3_9GAMM|nr:TetR/AcrR family transcriptional regulator [Methylovulum psychrotolerans]POZ51604.1 TetR/AcrR family transcriptional regulator [Methylovulum psychrotolerans]
MARRNQHSLETIKAMVLSAAETLVIEQGSSALTIRNIAAQIGYTVGSIYMAFDDRADVIGHINSLTLAELNRHLQPIPKPDVQALCLAYVSYAHSHYHRWQLWSETQAQDQGNKPVCVGYQAQVDALVGLFAAHLPAGSSPLSARTLWAGIQGVCTALLTAHADSVKDTEACALLLAARFC